MKTKGYWRTDDDLTYQWHHGLRVGIALGLAVAAVIFAVVIAVT